MKADTKLTVVICCKIFDRRSVAPPSGVFGGNRPRDRPVDKFKNKKINKKKLEGCLENHFRSRGRSSARGSPREFSISSDIKYGAHGSLRSTIENLS